MKFEKKIYVIGSPGMKAEFDKAGLQYTGFGVCVIVKILFCLIFWRIGISHKDFCAIKGIFKPKDKESRETGRGKKNKIWHCFDVLFASVEESAHMVKVSLVLFPFFSWFFKARLVKKKPKPATKLNYLSES